MTLFGLPDVFQVSAGALVAIIVVLVLTGRLVPRRTVDDLRADRDARILAAKEQTELWKHAYELAVQSRRSADSHVDELMEAARAAVQVIEVLPNLSPAHEGTRDAQTST
jgi:hypothetical protein